MLFRYFFATAKTLNNRFNILLVVPEPVEGRYFFIIGKNHIINNVETIISDIIVNLLSSNIQVIKPSYVAER